VAAEEEARMTLEIADEVRRQVEAAMASPGVAARIQQRLKVQRKRLHDHGCYLAVSGKAAVQQSERHAARKTCGWSNRRSGRPWRRR
jgi:hypothetical protein